MLLKILIVKKLFQSSILYLTLIAYDTDKVLLLRVSQHVFLKILLLLKCRIAALVVASEWTLVAVNIFDVNLKLGSGRKSRWTLIAMVVFDLEVAL